MLRDLAALFRRTSARADIVARYGGDEFLIVLHGAGAEEADAMAARLRWPWRPTTPAWCMSAWACAAPGRLHRLRLLPPGRQDCAA